MISSGAGLIAIASSREAVPPAASVTRAVIRHVPAAVGVPAIVAPLSDSPGGSVPLIVQLRDVPPVAASVCEYAAPTVPDGSDAVVIATAAVTTMLNAFVAFVPAASLTCTVKAKVPAAPGGPSITPCKRSSERPPGSDPAETVHWYGVAPPVAASVCV